MRLLRSTTAIHNRGIHYMIVASGNVLLPNGERYINDKKCWEYLEHASKVARWLGYVPFSAISDERNSEPIIRGSDIAEWGFLSHAHSTVKCNGQISGAEENLARGLVAEYLSGARVEFVLDPLDIGIGQNREVGTFWEVLPEEAVSVFVEAAFPRVIGLGKIG